MIIKLIAREIHKAKAGVTESINIVTATADLKCIAVDAPMNVIQIIASTATSLIQNIGRPMLREKIFVKISARMVNIKTAATNISTRTTALLTFLKMFIVHAPYSGGCWTSGN